MTRFSLRSIAADMNPSDCTKSPFRMATRKAFFIESAPDESKSIAAKVTYTIPPASCTWLTPGDEYTGIGLVMAMGAPDRGQVAEELPVSLIAGRPPTYQPQGA